VLSINSPIAEAWNGREVALSKLGLHAEAVNSYDKAIAINPNYPDAWINRGIALCELSRSSEPVATSETPL